MQDHERQVPLESLPPRVRQSVETQSRRATILGVWTETEHKTTIYKIELDVAGHGTFISLNAQGEITEIEEEVRLESIPAEARSAITRFAGRDGRIEIVRVVTIGSGSTGYNGGYKAVIRRGHKTREIRVNAEGKKIDRK